MSGTVDCETTGTPWQPGNSGIASWDPVLSDIMIEIYERCGKRAVELEPEHWQSARRSMGFVQSRWSNRNINLWKVELVSVPLTQGQIDVPVDPTVINVLDVYRSITYNGYTTDTVLYPIDRSDYAGIPNKDTEGPPTSFWFQRTQTPNMKLWPAVDAGEYVLNYYVFRRMQDAVPSMGLSPDLVQRFQEAYVAEVAAHVAQKWAPDRAAALATYAATVVTEAIAEDHEHVSTWIVPDLQGYFY